MIPISPFCLRLPPRFWVAFTLSLFPGPHPVCLFPSLRNPFVKPGSHLLSPSYPEKRVQYFLPFFSFRVPPTLLRTSTTPVLPLPLSEEGSQKLPTPISQQAGRQMVSTSTFFPFLDPDLLSLCKAPLYFPLILSFSGSHDRGCSPMTRSVIEIFLSLPLLLFWFFQFLLPVPPSFSVFSSHLPIIIYFS